ncbi:MAG: endolytic transglycosylase MltG [Candidatus Moraniibacteriota bacterium]
MRRFLIIAVALSAITFGGFLYLSSVAQYSHGVNKAQQRFEVQQGDNIFSLGRRLEDAGLIASRYAFLWHLTREGKTHALVAGTYGVSGNLTPSEIAVLITEGKTVSRDVKITFPEGWTLNTMAERLTANGLPGTEFLARAEQPLPEWRTKFDFLATLPVGASLEGYLFPDTYFFSPEATAEDIITALLMNFGKKMDNIVRQSNERNGELEMNRLHDVVTLASIIEEEGRTKEEREMISDIFRKRIVLGQPLQSDATINYILGTTRLQPTLKDLERVSPYNTYQNKGLPPGPISSPGLVSLEAAVFPKSNPYYYFLVDINTGETFYATTFEEHVKNRTLHGL